jgi:hypothetical protein
MLTASNYYHSPVGVGSVVIPAAGSAVVSADDVASFRATPGGCWMLDNGVIVVAPEAPEQADAPELADAFDNKSSLIEYAEMLGIHVDKRKSASAIRGIIDNHLAAGK